MLETLPCYNEKMGMNMLRDHNSQNIDRIALDIFQAGIRQRSINMTAYYIEEQTNAKK